MGFYDQKHTFPERRGQRVAAWVADYLATSGCTISEFAFRVRQDKRDVQRLLETKSCGHRLEDAIAAYFGWPFVKNIMAPVIEGSVEAEIAKERAEIAAKEARLARLEMARKSGGETPSGGWDGLARARSRLGIVGE